VGVNRVDEEMSNLLLLRICLPLEEIRYPHHECGCFPFYYYYTGCPRRNV